MMCRCSRETLTIAFLLLSTAFPLICGQDVTGIEGQPVTLPCSYKVKKNDDITSMCWGRGSCPSSKCNDVLIWTDGHRVTHRSSDRYRLNDNISQGIVSLTISQASMNDAGTYCCRIEHAGWFNDDKINIQLSMKAAPTTTPPTTTRRTKPIKTTLPPTTPKPPVTTVGTTVLLPTSNEMSTSTPSRSTTMIPTSEEPIDISTVPTAEPTTQPTTTAVATALPPIPPLPTVLHTTPTYTNPVDKTTTQEQPSSTDPCVTCDFSHEEIQPNEAFNNYNPAQPEGHSSENGFSDLFSGNMTTLEKTQSGFSLHILIIAICVAVIIMAVVAVLILRFRGKARGHYPFSLDPNLELVSHAENPLSEAEVEISQTVTLEVGKMDSGKLTL